MFCVTSSACLPLRYGLFCKTVTLGNNQYFFLCQFVLKCLQMASLFLSCHSYTHWHETSNIVVWTQEVRCPSIASLFQQYSSNPSASVMHILSMLLSAASSPFYLCVFAHTCVSGCLCVHKRRSVCGCVCGGEDSRGEPGWSCWNFLYILLVLKLSSQDSR